MKKAQLAIVGAAIALSATPALANSIVAGPFENRGQCHSWLPWKNGDDEIRGWGRYVPEGPYRLVCRQIEGAWYVVYE